MTSAPPTELATLGLPTDNAPATKAPIDTATRQRRRRQRLQMLMLITASYAVDTLLMAALCAAGAIDPRVPLLYASTAAIVCASFYVIFSSGWTDGLRDHYLALPYLVINSLVNIAFIVYAPEIGILMMMVLFIVFAFAALRMGIRTVMAGSIVVTVIVAVVAGMLGEQLALPTATWAQRGICGLWFGLVLGRSSLVGLYGAQLRVLLAQRNAELAATFEKIERLASHDELTGTLSRRAVVAQLDKERERAQRTGEPFGVALFDLDRFKRVNDERGHIVGDEVLRSFAATVSNCMRGTDTFGRYGGEEFVMLLANAVDDAAVAAAAERVRQAVEEHDWHRIAPGLAVTVSVGVSLFRVGETVEHLLSRADVALYMAKGDGRNCVRVC